VAVLIVTEPFRRYILDKTVGGFINVLSTSHICPRGDIVKQIGAKGFTSVLEGLYRKLVL